MDSTALIVWHSFLQSVPSEHKRELLGCISPKLATELQNILPPSQNLDQGFEPIEEEVTRVHYSWLAPFLRSLSENEIKLFLSSLTPEQAGDLKQSLLLSNTIPTSSLEGKNYLKKVLFDTIAMENLVPLACLPDDPLNCLLDISYEALNSLIDLLSMHDLSVEIRQIIETAKLKEIYHLLSKAQTTFLKTLLHKKEVVSFKKMGLISWNQDQEALRSMLLQRGINRIAKSLYGRHPSLLWYVAHRLDVEKGHHLIKLCTALDHPHASALLAEQVVELVSAQKTTTPPHNI